MEFDNKVQACMRTLEMDVNPNMSDGDGIAMIGMLYVQYGPEAIKEAVHRLEMGR